MNRPTRGLVLGKFLPPHLGHLHLIRFAHAYVDQLSVVVGTLSNEAIPGRLRYKWMQAACPNDTQVIHLAKDLPQDPSEHPRFWDLWRESLLGVLESPPDFVFASEDYGRTLAQVLGARFVMVDPGRENLPVSGTAIRENPMKHWAFLLEVVRPYFAREVVVFGPESTGKSTLTRNLASHFHTTYVPEYARTHLETKGSDISQDDIPLIAKGQQALAQACMTRTNRVLFHDTDLLTTAIWSQWLYGHCPTWINERAEASQFDLYLLLDVDVPWQADPVRYLPRERRSFFDRCRQELERLNKPYLVVRGDWQTRFETAVNAVKALLADTPTPADDSIEVNS